MSRRRLLAQVREERFGRYAQIADERITTISERVPLAHDDYGWYRCRICGHWTIRSGGTCGRWKCKARPVNELRRWDR